MVRKDGIDPGFLCIEQIEDAAVFPDDIGEEKGGFLAHRFDHRLAGTLNDGKVQPLLGERLAEFIEARVLNEMGEELAGVRRIPQDSLAGEFLEGVVRAGHPEEEGEAGGEIEVVDIGELRIRGTGEMQEETRGNQ